MSKSHTKGILLKIIKIIYPEHIFFTFLVSAAIRGYNQNIKYLTGEPNDESNDHCRNRNLRRYEG